MRSQRTKDEDWAIRQLVPYLEAQNEHWEIDDSVTDSPDLVLFDPRDQKRVACEITSVGIKEWHQWSKDPKMQLDVGELDEIVLPREADYWLTMVLASKNQKITKYLSNANASEAWLLIHGDANDFFSLEEDDYDIPLMRDVSLTESHQFARIFVASPRSRSRMLVQVHPTDNDLPAPDLSVSTNIKAMQIRSIKLDISKGGVVYAPIGKEFKPARQIVLPPLDPSRK